jgi:hypothetical protein
MMNLNIFSLLFVLLFSTGAPKPDEPKIDQQCCWKGKKLYGKIKFVQNFPDIKTQIVDNFPDLKVKLVENFPDHCGEWKVVENFPDLKVQIVESFPDIKVKLVENFPGKP